MIFYHGSPVPLQIGTILRPQGGEMVIGRGVDEVLEKYRPKNIPLPRHRGVFLVPDIAEGEEHWGDDEHVYVVEPLGPVYGPFHVAFVNEIDSVLNLENQPEYAPELAEMYWSGDMRDQPGEEYYTEGARVVKYLGLHHELWESVVNDIRRRAGLPLKEAGWDDAKGMFTKEPVQHGADVSRLPKDIQKQIADYGPTEGLNPKVAELVYALNDEGIPTTMSGDLYGDELVYVDIHPDIAAQIEDDSVFLNKGWNGWKLTHTFVPLTYYEILGKPIPQKRAAVAKNFLKSAAPRNRLARPGNNPVTAQEAQRIIALLQMDLAVLNEDMTPAQALRYFKKHGIDARGLDRDGLRKARARINMTKNVHPERGGSEEAMQELNAATQTLINQPQAKPADFQDFKPKQAGQTTTQGKPEGWRPFTDFVKQYQDVQRGPRPTQTYRGKA